MPGHAAALDAIRRRVEEARPQAGPVAWVRHHNRPGEDPPGAEAFVPGSWGAALLPGLGPAPGRAEEAEFVKDAFGAVAGTDLDAWLAERGSVEVLLVGFYALMCGSTTVREGLMRGLRVAVDPDATGAVALRHSLLGGLRAGEARRTALLQLAHLDVAIAPCSQAATGEHAAETDERDAARRRP